MARKSAPSVMLTVEPPGAVWPHVDALVRELSAQGVEVIVAAITPLRPGQRIEYAGIPNVELRPCPFPVVNAQEHMEKRAQIAEWLLTLEETLNPDIIHLTGYLHAGLPWCGKVLVAGYPGSGASYGKLEAEQRRQCRNAFLHGLKGADLVVTPTETMMSALVRNFGIEKGRVIRDGRDPARFQQTVKEPVILSVGPQRDDPASRSVLERIAHRLPWPVVAAGDQPDEQGRNMKLEGISTLGRLHITQLVPWFARSAIYVALSAEGPGTWINEAALAGCALVLADVPALREVWAGAALFVPADDAEALMIGLKSMSADRRLREAMGQSARTRALTQTARMMGTSYVSAYRDLIAARAPNQFAETKLA